MAKAAADGIAEGEPKRMHIISQEAARVLSRSSRCQRSPGPLVQRHTQGPLEELL